MIACRHFAHRLAIGVEDCIAMTGNSLVRKFDADELLCHAVCLLLCEGFLADELGLVELAEHREASHDGGDVCAELVAIEGQTDLEAQGVATTEAAGLATTALDELVPRLLCEFVRTVDLEAVLASIASARHNDSLPRPLQRRGERCGCLSSLSFGEG